MQLRTRNRPTPACAVSYPPPVPPIGRKRKAIATPSDSNIHPSGLLSNIVTAHSPMRTPGSLLVTGRDNQPSLQSPVQPKRKRVKYVHTPGNTPFPEFIHPTPEECREVQELLVSVHGESIRPSRIEVNNSVSGCGEVPSVLDALMRTILSANTTNTNSARAFQGLVERFGLLREPNKNNDENDEDNGNNKAKIRHEDEKQSSELSAVDKAKSIGIGSVNWDAVRRAPRKALYEAIKHGGLADIKSRSMKAILDQVWEEGKMRNQKAREEAGLYGIKSEHEEGELNLDYLKDWDDEAVKEKLTSYKGVGQKTASCVLLFCLQRESFAVDTHVFRLSKFLGWIPEAATRETAYFHLDTRIPNDLKYSLHNLLIRHGRTCKHCKGGPQKKQKGKLKTPTSPDVKKQAVDINGNPVEVKRTKKIWVGNGLMKEVAVEVETSDENGEFEDRCVLETLVKRVRRERRTRT